MGFEFACKSKIHILHELKIWNAFDFGEEKAEMHLQVSY